MKAAGYGDVLNQGFQENPIRVPRATAVTNGWINSFNGYRRFVGDYAYETAKEKAGNNIDWIFASNHLPVKSWKVVIDYDRYLQLTGQAKGLLEVLRGDPPFDDELVIERDKSPGRDVSFE